MRGKRIANLLTGGALLVLLSGCASTLWQDTDWRGKPVQALEDRIGDPIGVREVSPDLSIVLWQQNRPAGSYFWAPDPYSTAFFVRGDGTVIGSTVDSWCGSFATIRSVVAVLGPPTRIERSNTGGSLCTWEPGTGTVTRRLTLGVRDNGWVLFWN